MRKIITFMGMLAICSTVVGASEVSDLALKMTGFKIIENNSQLMKLQFREDKPIIISKQKFTSEAGAKEFCTVQGAKLDDDGIGDVLLLAMSGAASVNDEIKSAIVFDLGEEMHGVWVWAGSGNKVVIMLDGHGTDISSSDFATMEKTAKEHNKSEAAAIPSICK